jgi:thiol-disulfide isomerase/thioredoxin
MSFETIRVLKPNDFRRGNIVSKSPTFVMVQSNSCGYCTDAKPEFVKASKRASNKNITFATIQTDGDKRDEAIAKSLKSGQLVGIEPMNAVPVFLLFNNGKFVKQFDKNDRSAKSLSEFLKESL